MNAIVSDVVPLSLPSDDGRLDEALADLRSKLAAWSGAICHAQSLLVERMRNEPLVFAPSTDKDTCPSLSTADPVTPEAEDSPTATQEAPVAPKRVEYAAVVQTSSEDEALLATLDPDTVVKVQVLRRLSNYQKSVRELLEAHHISQPATDPGHAKKKSFWRR